MRCQAMLRLLCHAKHCLKTRFIRWNIWCFEQFNCLKFIIFDKKQYLQLRDKLFAERLLPSFTLCVEVLETSFNVYCLNVCAVMWMVFIHIGWWMTIWLNYASLPVRRTWLTHQLLFVYQQVMKQQPYELRRRLYIMFKGEEGLDYGGIARLVAYKLISPNLLWRQSTRAQQRLKLFYTVVSCHIATSIWLWLNDLG